MPRFFVNVPLELEPETIVIDGADAHHISHSLRMRVGERLILCDQNKREFSCRIIGFTSSSVEAAVESVAQSRAEAPYSAVIYQAIVKSDRFEYAVQKSTEEGASRIVAFSSGFCSVKPEAYSPSKLCRAEKIALEAAKQSGRAAIPKIEGVLGFSEAVSEASRAQLSMFFYEGEGTVPLSSALPPSLPRDASISCMIGSEGGFSKEEADSARKAGMLLVGLGPRILRAETVAPHILAVLSYRYEL